MSENQMSAILGLLSNDVILTCDPEGVVQHANVVAERRLGSELVGRPLLKLLSTMSRPKGIAFVEQLRTLTPGQTTEPWELLFHLARSTPLLICMRGAILDDGCWLLVGGLESPQLTTLYHEVLTINNELTNLVRRLSKEQAHLSRHLSRLLTTPESSGAEASEQLIAHELETMREALIQRTAEALTYELPMIGVSDHTEDREIQHQQQMLSTARRFHELTQVAATLDWHLVEPEYDWTRRRLEPMGITWSHQQTLIDTYFAAAASLRDWDEGERSTLEAIADRMREIGSESYTG